ncbi:MAG: MmgE/PrpD family protein [Thermovirga sp.]|nr:MmgE/PrpD family protein [Thermovirga sp.]
MTVEKTINQQLSEFIVGLRYEDIPKEVLSHLKDVMLDGYGCALFGSTTPWMKMYRQVLCRMSDRKEATIWGTDLKTSVIPAMMINGAAINSFELDDTHTDGIIHVSTGVLGCVTSFAELIEHVSGREFLTAAALAFEISCRVAAPVGMEIAHKGFNNTGTCCPFGSTAAVSKLLGLDTEQTKNAMGIAGNWAGGLQAVQFTSMAKRIVPSRSSAGAIIGGLLAREGFTGIEDVFENEFGGFYHCFSDHIYDKERICGQLGERWELMGIGLKFYSTCRSKHTTIDALRNFMQENPDVKADDIEKITVRTTSITEKYALSNQEIKSIVAAQLSHPYVCAVTLLEGTAFIDQFTEEKIKDPRILEFMKKVEVIADEEIENLPRELRYTVKLDVRLRDGRVFHLRQEFPKGHPKNPFTKEELFWKFKQLAGRAFEDEAKLNKIIEGVQNLEELGNISELIKLLSKESY